MCCRSYAKLIKLLNVCCQADEVQSSCIRSSDNCDGMGVGSDDMPGKCCKKELCLYCVKYDQLECCARDCLQYAQPLDENYNEFLEKVVLAISPSIYHWLHIVT